MVENSRVFDPFMGRFIGRITGTLIVLFIIIVWAFSMAFFSSSVVHVCVSSRKLGSVYCLSVGSDPGPAFYTMHVPLDNVSETLVSGGGSSGLDHVVNGSKKGMGCDGKGVYVYELPSKFNRDLVRDCRDMVSGFDLCRCFVNDGLGDPVTELGEGWFNTNLYSLELIYHSRVLNHPCRVQYPEKASLFYVPFYGGLDMLRWRFKDVAVEVKDSLSMELVQWLEEQGPWVRNHGSDHVSVLLGTGLPKLELLFQNHPWPVNDLWAPHPTHFHPSSDHDIEEWQSRLRKSQRKNLIGFAGAPHKALDDIRSTLIEQCTAESETTCRFLDCSRNACVNPAPVINLFTESEFCLHPDTGTSAAKSVLDSLVAGCIPVVFDPLMTHKNYSIYIDKDEIITSDVNVIKRLEDIPQKTRQKMREHIIHELMPKIIYSNPNGKLEKFEDAFDISMNHLFKMVIEKLPSS